MYTRDIVVFLLCSCISLAISASDGLAGLPDGFNQAPERQSALRDNNSGAIELRNDLADAGGLTSAEDNAGVTDIALQLLNKKLHNEWAINCRNHIRDAINRALEIYGTTENNHAELLAMKDEADQLSGSVSADIDDYKNTAMNEGYGSDWFHGEFDFLKNASEKLFDLLSPAIEKKVRDSGIVFEAGELRDAFENTLENSLENLRNDTMGFSDLKKDTATIYGDLQEELRQLRSLLTDPESRKRLSSVAQSMDEMNDNFLIAAQEIFETKNAEAAAETAAARTELTAELNKFSAEFQEQLTKNLSDADDGDAQQAALDDMKSQALIDLSSLWDSIYDRFESLKSTFGEYYDASLENDITAFYEELYGNIENLDDYAG